MKLKKLEKKLAKLRVKMNSLQDQLSQKVLKNLRKDSFYLTPVLDNIALTPKEVKTITDVYNAPKPTPYNDISVSQEEIQKAIGAPETYDLHRLIKENIYHDDHR